MDYLQLGCVLEKVEGGVEFLQELRGENLDDDSIRQFIYDLDDDVLLEMHDALSEDALECEAEESFDNIVCEEIKKRKLDID